MNERLTTIMSLLKKLTEEENQLVRTNLPRIFGKKMEFFDEELPLLSDDEMDIIIKVLNGMILTKEYAPKIDEEFERLKDTELPSKVEFGRLDVM
ncbi:hypothetical protein I6N90_08165 [Paenibacillus sp. GSMTC-2017]|uniref:hypothetical protein n=1 Tax=Paenibacillus sp. GSMTC-2017 TaxID=2794350 RepID=UPI0018D7F936|nr:hypothetical protein [Paenibacillus sp. GSMTC-2017]MBH5317777.1 hypothetical protein [Paenibacillus sp. GSMTC-2017]